MWYAFGCVFGLGVIDVEAVLLHYVFDRGGGLVDEVGWYPNVEVVQVSLCKCRGGGVWLWVLLAVLLYVVVDL